MMIYLSLIALTIFTSIWSLNSPCVAQDSKEKSDQNATAVSDWLEGSGETLRMRVRGKILEHTGESATDCQIRAYMKSEFANVSLNPTLKGNEFEFWVPVNSVRWSYIVVDVESPGGDAGQRIIGSHELRDIAVNGLQLSVSAPSRFIEVSVIQGGQPVANAHVQLSLIDSFKTTKSDDSGVARFAVLPTQTLKALTAWCDDFRLGGYLFGSDSERDPDAISHVVEVTNCQTKKIQVVDEAQNPVANVDCLITVEAGGNHVNWTGITEKAVFKTDATGSASYPWCPDWENAEIRISPVAWEWLSDVALKTNGDSILATMKRRPVHLRKTVTGKLKSDGADVGGMLVTLESFQGENEGELDWLKCYSDPSGEFRFQVLPDKTYCAYVNDRLWVSEIIDLVPYESAGEKTNSPELTVAKGVELKVRVTQGDKREPIAFQLVRLESPHSYSWREPGKTENGTGGRTWFVVTDENGEATTYAHSGLLESYIYTPSWRPKIELDVMEGSVLEFHRTAPVSRTILGRLTLDEQSHASLAKAEIAIASVDGETNDRVTALANDDGSFEFETKATQVGIFASTRDSTAAGFLVVDKLDEEIQLSLSPTQTYHGLLIGSDDKPLVDQIVRAVVRVPDKERWGSSFPRSFEAKVIETTTDEYGNFSLQGLPTGLMLQIRTPMPDAGPHGAIVEYIKLSPNEARERAVTRLKKAKNSTAPRSWSERFDRALKDSSLIGCHLMVLVYSSDDVAPIIDNSFLNSAKTTEVNSFFQVQLRAGDTTVRPEDLEFARDRLFTVPDEKSVFACVFNSEGRELERIELSLEDPLRAELAEAFIRQNCPTAENAQEKWEATFKEAKQTDRKVWITISGRYCAPCILLARWLDDRKTLLAKDYVFLKIDDGRDVGGAEIARRIVGSDHYGIPFQLIFDENEKQLINCESPLGNIGFPSGYEGKKHLRKMLMETRTRLTDEEIDNIVASLKD